MLDIVLLPDEYAVCLLPTGAPIPVGLLDVHSGNDVVSVTRAAQGVSIICPSRQVPADAIVETPWRCLAVPGPLDVVATGVLARLAVPLAEARVDNLAFSTFDTDYLLVPSVRVADAIAALRDAGHRVSEPVASC